MTPESNEFTSVRVRFRKKRVLGCVIKRKRKAGCMMLMNSGDEAELAINH